MFQLVENVDKDDDDDLVVVTDDDADDDGDDFCVGFMDTNEFDITKAAC